MALEQTVEAALLARAAHLAELKRPKLAQLPDTAVRSTSTGPGRPRTANGFFGRILTAGSSMCPARASASISPRATMSRSAPFPCRQSQASHSRCDSRRRLSPAWAAISSRMK